MGLVLVIFSLARTRRSHTTPAAVGAYIGAAYFFTSSASFANPAISIGRIFSNTFAGIAPASVPGFILAQLAGGTVVVGQRARALLGAVRGRLLNRRCDPAVDRRLAGS